jgi:polysaccharide pyruvyl transferase WcaK-like protein
MRALILNDTRNGNHLGCIIVMEQLEALCREAGLHVNAMLRFVRHFEKQVAHELGQCDVVIINGEGTMHHDAAGAMALMRAGAMAASRKVPIALINTVWQDNQLANPLLAQCRWVSARESFSQTAIAHAGTIAELVPDLTLTADPAQLFQSDLSTATGGIVVLDDVRLPLSLALAHYARARGLPYFPMGARPSLRTQHGWLKMIRLGLASGWARQFHRCQIGAIASATVVVTGRFHGICLAILAGRPFVAFTSNTHKIEGLLRDADLGQGGRLFDDPPTDPVARDNFIDEAVRKVLAHQADPAQRAAYQAACARYTQRARQSATDLLGRIARGQ